MEPSRDELADAIDRIHAALRHAQAILQKTQEALNDLRIAVMQMRDPFDD